jgi:hypothetical protein
MAKDKSILLENASFDPVNVAGKAKDSFVKEMMATKIFSGYSDADRKKLLEKAWELCKKEVTPVAPITSQTKPAAATKPSTADK